MSFKTGPSPVFRSPWWIVLLLFAGSLALFTRDNGFSFDYHPDEDGKTRQILARERNYHHPLLMLNATDLVVHVAGVPKTDQAVVVAGRWVSAGFAAGAVALLGLLAFTHGGGLAALAVGALVATHAELYKAAHYLKEDATLVFGIALFFVALDRFARKPSLAMLRFLGIASGVATAGKYLGIVTLLFSLPLVWKAPVLAPKLRWKHFLIAFAATFLILNLPPTTHPSSPFKSLRREVVGATGHRGLTRDVPHARYVSMLQETVPAGVLALAGVYALILAATWRRRTFADWLLLLFPVLYFGMLSYSPKTGGRYLLPVTMLLCALAGLAIMEIAQLFRRWRFVSPVALAAGILLVVPFQLPSLRATMADFRRDDRLDLVAWIREHVAPTAFIVEDHRVNLEEHRESGGLKPEIFDEDYAADVGTIDALRTWGDVYVAVSPRAYSRFFSELKPRPSEKEAYTRRKEFYARLFAEGELVWERLPGGNIYLQPGLRLYRLKP